MESPSGDQVGLETFVAWRVTARAPPPAAGIVKIWPSRRKLICLASGDQRGDDSAASPAVSWTGAPPAMSWSQMWPGRRFAFQSTWLSW